MNCMWPQGPSMQSLVVGPHHQSSQAAKQQAECLAACLLCFLCHGPAGLAQCVMEASVWCCSTYLGLFHSAREMGVHVVQRLVPSCKARVISCCLAQNIHKWPCPAQTTNSPPTALCTIYKMCPFPLNQETWHLRIHGFQTPHPQEKTKNFRKIEEESKTILKVQPKEVIGADFS